VSVSITGIIARAPLFRSSIIVLLDLKTSIISTQPETNLSSSKVLHIVRDFQVDFIATLSGGNLKPEVGTGRTYGLFPLHHHAFGSVPKRFNIVNVLPQIHFQKTCYVAIFVVKCYQDTWEKVLLKVSMWTNGI